MFEIGRKYEFHRLEFSDGAYGRMTSWGIVSRIDGPLIEINNNEIININSPTFEGAIDEEGRLKMAASMHVEFIESGG